MTSRLKTTWTDHLKEEGAKESFKQYLLNSPSIFARLKQILEDRKRFLENEEIKSDLYSEPSVAFKLAYINGRKKELRDLEELISFSK